MKGDRPYTLARHVVISQSHCNVAEIIRSQEQSGVASIPCPLHSRVTWRTFLSEGEEGANVSVALILAI